MFNRPALTGHIVFIAAHGTYGDETIFTAADGADERQLTEPNVRCCPRLLRDGTQVLMMDPASPTSATGGGGIIGIDSSGVTLLPLRDRTLNYKAWARSSDGRIGFGGWDPAHPDRPGIYTARVDGEDVVRVTPVVAIHDVPTDFSPDSARLIFFPAVVTEPEPWDLGGSLWLVNVDGTGARRIKTAGHHARPVGPLISGRHDDRFRDGSQAVDGDMWSENADAPPLRVGERHQHPPHSIGGDVRRGGLLRRHPRTSARRCPRPGMSKEVA